MCVWRRCQRIATARPSRRRCAAVLRGRYAYPMTMMPSDRPKSAAERSPRSTFSRVRMDLSFVIASKSRSMNRPERSIPALPPANLVLASGLTANWQSAGFSIRAVTLFIRVIFSSLTAASVPLMVPRLVNRPPKTAKSKPAGFRRQRSPQYSCC